MSFIVRQISRTADGRQIIRPRTLDKVEISVGRDTACDIHLPDLAVTLRHAALIARSPARVEMISLSGLPFDVNGRQTERAEIDPSQLSTVRIGSHTLTLSRGEGDEARAVIVTVERVGALSDASEAKDETRAFSLSGVLPGKRPLAWTLALLVLLACLAWPIASFFMHRHDRNQPVAFHSDEMWSSGKLSLVHATLQNDCQACHEKPFVSVRDASCTACHTKVHDHADPRRLAAAKAMPGLGGRIQLAFKGAFNVPTGSCVDCHTEHQGATAMPVTAQKFCSDCHGTLDQRLTDTKILDASDFGTDHPQFRPAIMTTPEAATPIVQRVSLDARPLEDNGLKFPHAMHLSKTGGVAQMARTMSATNGFGQNLTCADCHVPDSTGARFVPVTMEKNCGMCHSLAFDRVDGTVRTLRHGDPAQVIAEMRAFYRSGGALRPIAFDSASRRRPGDGVYVRRYMAFTQSKASGGAQGEAAIRQVFGPGGTCGECHRMSEPGQNGTNMVGIVPVRLPTRYMSKGWFDHAAHLTETCQSCHAAEKSNDSADVLLPKIAECRACHGGESAHKEVPSSCAMCHDFHQTSGTPLMQREKRSRGRRTERVEISARTKADEGG